MTRTARFDELGHPQHVYAQGINRCALFEDDFDRIAFLVRLERICREEGIEVLAWALMTNHFHLVLEATGGRLSRAMQRLLCAYAVYFNRRHGRVGRLFRNRFQSRPVEDDDDLGGLIAYVLLNPLRAGIVSSVDELNAYPWTSLAELSCNSTLPRSIVARARVLASYGPTESIAVAQLVEILRQRHLEQSDAADTRGADPRARRAKTQLPLCERDRDDLRVANLSAIGLRDARIDRTSLEQRTSAARRRLLRTRAWTVDRCVSRAAQIVGTLEPLVRAGRRTAKVACARTLVAYFAPVFLGVTDADVGRATGVSRQAVARARNRGRDEASKRGLTWDRFFEVPAAAAQD